MIIRRSVALFIIANLLVLSYLVSRVWILITLLFVDGSADAISRAELPAPDSRSIENQPQLIPKIIHQTYANESVPEMWLEAQQTCMDLHEDYEYKLWTDKMAREFITTEYPWFLETYDRYEFPIQRADAIRYFVLAHYGGIYIDLDDGCNRRLDPLLAYPAWLRRTIPTGISNDAMGAIPRHPFFLKVIDALPDYSRSWVLPYVTVMGSTGPLFLSVMWRHYNSDGPAPTGNNRVRVLFPDEYNNHPWSFFSHHTGNSWHGNDVRLVFWMSHHWLLLTVTGFLVGFTVLFVMYWAYGRFVISTGGFRRRDVIRRRLFPARSRRSIPGGKDDYELRDRLQA